MKTTVEGVATALLEARRAGKSVDPGAFGLEPNDMDAAYAIQQFMISTAPSSVAGWKVGCANAKQQELLRVTEPFLAPVFASNIYRSPATLEASSFYSLGIECELMFELAVDVEPRSELLSAAELGALVGAVRPGFEIFSSCLIEPFKSGAATLTADCGGNGALVCGAPIVNWRDYAIAAAETRLVVNDQEVARGSGANVLGDPLRSFEWFVRKAQRLGFALNAGDIVATGSLTPVYYAKSRDVISANFGAFGEIALRFE